MPSTNPHLNESAAAQLRSMGAHIRAHRKALRVSGAAAAEAAGISRVTLYRIEKGEPSVTVGAWANVVAALGLTLDTRGTGSTAPGAGGPAESADWMPVRIRLADYPQLQSLAWQVHGTDTLTPKEALDIYERNARHLDTQAMTAAETTLLQALRAGLRDV